MLLTDKQTNQRRRKHNLLGRRNKKSRNPICSIML